MFSSLKSFFQDNLAPTAAIDEETRLRIATCALLLEVAHADDHYTDDEVETIMALVSQRFAIDGAHTAALLQVAEEARLASGDLYQFARLINESFTRPRKLAVLELLWEVVYSDGILEAHEDALLHKMATLLSVRHDELMALKTKIKREHDD